MSLKTHRHTGRLLILSLLFVLLTYLVATAISIVGYAKIDEKRPCDVAIVLGAGTMDGDVSPVFRERIHHAVWLYEQGYVSQILLTGGVGRGNAEADSVIGKRYTVSCGVVEEDILIEEVSTITEENLFYAKALMDEHGLKTAILVSDPLHMKRAMLMAEDYGIDAVSSPTPTTMYRSLKTKLPFLAREEFFYIGYRIVRIFR
jgi:uncharacterized SAM-binding protein YcdF (DUF218 family)